MTLPSWRTKTLADLDPVAREILDTCATDRKFALYGSLGAGKTALVRAFCRQLGLPEAEISSPSFALANEYGPEPAVFHLDLYRIRQAEELFALGLERYLDGPEYCFIEWPEIAESWLPDHTVSLRISVLDDGERLIEPIRSL
jgi:tRNA threonylcarbamoyladenosine biosynthesis protein TsaE